MTSIHRYREDAQLVVALCILGLAVAALVVGFQQQARTAYFAGIVSASCACLLAGAAACSVSIASIRRRNGEKDPTWTRQALMVLTGPILLWQVSTLIFSLWWYDQRQAQLSLAFLLLGWSTSLTILWIALRWKQVGFRIPSATEPGN